MIAVAALAAAALVAWAWWAKDGPVRTEQQARPALEDSDLDEVTDPRLREILARPMRGKDYEYEAPPLPDVPLRPISGRVVGPEGAGVGGIQVSAWAQDPAPPRWREYGAKVHTEADGSFEFPGLPLGVYDVQILLKTLGRPEVDVRQGIAAGTADIEFVLRAPPVDLPYFLTLDVRGPAGGPLPAGFVSWFNDPFSDFGITEGRVVLWTRRRPPPGWTHAWVTVYPEEDSGAVPTGAPVDLRAEGPQTIRLDTPWCLEGRVVCGSEPVAARVASGPVSSVDTDADGRFRIERLPREPIALRVVSDAYGTAWPIPVEPGERHVVLRVAERVRVTGELRLPPEIAAEGLEVSLWGAADAHLRVRLEELRFDLGPLVPGRRFELRVRGPHTAPASIWFDAAERFVRVPLRAGFVLRGRVVSPNGEQLPGVRVEARDPLLEDWHDERADPVTTESGADGRFQLSGLAGDEWIEAGDGKLVQRGGPIRANVADGATLVLDPAGQIRGRLVDPSGRTFYGLVARWAGGPMEEVEGARFSVFQDGRFFVQPVGPGRHLVYVHRADHDDWRVADNRYALATLEAGTEDARLVLRAGRAVSGRVRMPTDRAAQWLVVRLRGRWGTRLQWMWGDRFAFHGVPPEPCTVEVREPHSLRTTGVVRVGPGDTEVALKLR